MTDETGYGVLTDAQWAELAPLIEQSRPPHKTEHDNLRRTIEAIVWRHENGVKWRSIPPHLGPWWMAAQTFIRWSRHGVWERLMELAQQRDGVKLGMAFLDGTTIRAHQKAAGAVKKGGLPRSATSVRRWAAHVAASPPRPPSSWTAPAGRSALLSLPDRPMNCRWRRFC
jgi:transposase